ncbi:MAG TPA: DUF4157 domain-containing protein [Kofleriaceae bacterium]|nr:DUF4157 domain-containing protein [Kofleriaceae bacterium]
MTFGRTPRDAASRTADSHRDDLPYADAALDGFGGAPRATATGAWGVPTGPNPFAGVAQAKAGSSRDGAAAPAARGGGSPLDGDTRSDMESSFGASFGDVRIHQDGGAEQAGALAYTRGTDIHFAAGQYQPETDQGAALLGHELAHVQQQRAGAVATQHKGGIAHDAGLEAEADRAGAAAAAGKPAAVTGAASATSGESEEDQGESEEDGPAQAKLAWDRARFVEETGTGKSFKSSEWKNIIRAIEAYDALPDTLTDGPGGYDSIKVIHALTAIQLACQAWLGKHEHDNPRRKRKDAARARVVTRIAERDVPRELARVQPQERTRDRGQLRRARRGGGLDLRQARSNNPVPQDQIEGDHEPQVDEQVPPPPTDIPPPPMIDAPPQVGNIAPPQVHGPQGHGPEEQVPPPPKLEVQEAKLVEPPRPQVVENLLQHVEEVPAPPPVVHEAKQVEGPKVVEHEQHDVEQVSPPPPKLEVPQLDQPGVDAPKPDAPQKFAPPRIQVTPPEEQDGGPPQPSREELDRNLLVPPPRAFNRMQRELVARGLELPPPRPLPDHDPHGDNEVEVLPTPGKGPQVEVQPPETKTPEVPKNNDTNYTVEGDSHETDKVDTETTSNYTTSHDAKSNYSTSNYSSAAIKEEVDEETPEEKAQRKAEKKKRKEEKRRRKEAEEKEKDRIWRANLEKQRLLPKRLKAARKAKKERLQPKQVVVKSGYTSKYTTEDDAPKNNYAVSNYTTNNDQQDDDDLDDTPKVKVTLTNEEKATVERELDRELGLLALPDTQEKFSGHEQPEDVQTMQRSLREGSLTRSDTFVNSKDQRQQVERGQLSDNELGSTGWALLPMTKEHYSHDRGEHNTKDVKFETNYLFNEGEDLARRAEEKLGTTRSEGREQTVLRFVDGVWKNADNEVVNTTEAGHLNQAVNERKSKLEKKQKELREQVRSEEVQGVDQGRLDGLIARLDKLQEKLKLASLEQHPTVRGKFIYVMNAAGQFFAAQAQQWILHHSSFLAGGAVASAGEVGIENGRLTSISNQSGHYRPGPAYLWQAVKQLHMLGVPLEGVAVTVMGVGSRFRNAQHFLDAMDPAADPKWFDSDWAIGELKKAVAQEKEERRTQQHEQPPEQKAQV